jgi:myosin heavy subunit
MRETKKKCPYCSRMCKIPNIVLVAASTCPSSSSFRQLPTPAKSAAHAQELAELKSLNTDKALEQIKQIKKPEVISDLISSVAGRMNEKSEPSSSFGGGTTEQDDVELLQAGLEKLSEMNRPLSVDAAAKLGELIHAWSLAKETSKKSAAAKLRTLWQRLEPHSFDAWGKLQQLREQAAALLKTIGERNTEQARIDEAVAESKRILRSLENTRRQAEAGIKQIEAKKKKATPEKLAVLQELRDKMNQIVAQYDDCQKRIGEMQASHTDKQKTCDQHKERLAKLEQTAATACSEHEEKLKTCDSDTATKDARIQELERILAAYAANKQSDGDAEAKALKAKLDAKEGQLAEKVDELNAKDGQIATLEREVGAFVKDRLLQVEVATLKEKLEACDAETTKVLNSDELSTNAKYANVEELEKEMAELRAKLKMCEGIHPESVEQGIVLCEAWFTTKLNEYKTQWAENYQQQITANGAEHQAAMATTQAEKAGFEKAKVAWEEATVQVEAEKHSFMEKNAQTVEVAAQYAALNDELALEKDKLAEEYGNAYKKHREELVASHETEVKKFNREKDEKDKVLAARSVAYDNKLSELTSDQWHVNEVAELENAKHEAQVAADDARAAKKKHEENVKEIVAARKKMDDDIAAQNKSMQAEKADLDKLKKEQNQLIEQKVNALFQTTFEQKNRLALDAKRAACVDIEAIVTKFETQFDHLSKQYDDTCTMAPYVAKEFEKAVKKVLTAISKENSDGQEVDEAERVAQLGKALDAALADFKQQAKTWVQVPAAELKEMLAGMAQVVREAETRADEAMVDAGRGDARQNTSSADLGGGEHRTYSSMFYSR